MALTALTCQPKVRIMYIMLNLSSITVGPGWAVKDWRSVLMGVSLLSVIAGLLSVACPEAPWGRSLALGTQGIVML